MKGQPVEIVSSYKYLGVTIDESLNFAEHIHACTKKANKRMYFLRKLKKFKVSKEMLLLFYKSSIQSVMLYNAICFYGNATLESKAKFNRVHKAAAKIIGSKLEPLDSRYKEDTLKKMKRILPDSKHPLSVVFGAHRSSRECSNRFRSLKAKTNRLYKSFIPTAIRLYNEL